MESFSWFPVALLCGGEKRKVRLPKEKAGVALAGREDCCGHSEKLQSVGVDVQIKAEVSQHSFGLEFPKLQHLVFIRERVPSISPQPHTLKAGKPHLSAPTGQF